MAVTHSLTSEGHDASEDGTGRGTPLVAAPRVARQAKGGFTDPVSDNIIAATLNSGGNAGGFRTEPGEHLVTGLFDARYGVRRLTPIECERLQGFPDNWTAGQSDSKRYRQLGNAVAVPVAEWLGRRIMEVERTP